MYSSVNLIVYKDKGLFPNIQLFPCNKSRYWAYIYKGNITGLKKGILHKFSLVSFRLIYVKGSITNKTFFPESYPEYPILT